MIKDFSTIILLAGLSTRCDLGYNKVLYLINNKPVFRYSLDKFLEFENCKKVVIVCKKDDEKKIKHYLNDTSKIEIAYGGDTRQLSVLNGLKKVDTQYVLIHDGARPIIEKKDIISVLSALENNRSVSLASPSYESLRFINDNSNSILDRDKVVNIKTPQGVMKDDLMYSLNEAINDGLNFTDDVSVIEKYCNIIPKIVLCNNTNIKITKNEDLEIVESLLKKKSCYRIGHSCDTHRLEKGEGITIGGIFITCEFAVVAHSDGDVLFHSLAEAIIGALGKGDLGKWFSDKDAKYKGISSKYFLERTKEMLENEGYEIVNIDSTIYIEKPMMSPYIDLMKENISDILGIENEIINIKATRGEKVGPIGESKAVSSETVILLKK